jgi:uncharacterized protein (DUF58 family)
MAFGPNVVAVREIMPQRVVEGELARGVLTVTNAAGRRSPPFLAIDRIDGRTLTVALPSLAAGARTKAAYPLPTERRGVYEVGPLSVGHTDPLRLMRLTGDYATASRLVVHPQLYPVEPIPTGFSRDLDGPTTGNAPNGGITFHSLREYLPGDDHRLIHAKSSARAGTLMVRHNVVPNEPRMMVVLDTGARSYAPGMFEEAVRVVASLAMAALAGGFPLQVRTTGGSAIASDRAMARSELLDVLAGVRPRAEDAGLGALLAMAPGEEGVSLGVVTGSAGAATLGAVATVRQRFQTVSLIRIGPAGRRPGAVWGVLLVEAPSARDFAVTWNRLVRG